MNDPDVQDQTPNASQSGSESSGKSCLVAATLAAALLIGIAFLMIGSLKQDLPPELTRKSFDSAWDTWQANAPPDYHIEIEVVGPQPATYAVEVRDTKVVAAMRNGEPLPPQPRTMRTWSVPGMFDTIEHDVMRIEKPEPSQLSLRAEFDPELGYPSKYFRNDYRNRFEMRWTVTGFKTNDATP